MEMAANLFLFSYVHSHERDMAEAISLVKYFDLCATIRGWPAEWALNTLPLPYVTPEHAGAAGRLEQTNNLGNLGAAIFYLPFKIWTSKILALKCIQNLNVP